MHKILPQENQQLEPSAKRTEQRKVTRIHSTETIFTRSTENSPFRDPQERRSPNNIIKSYQSKLKAEKNSLTKILGSMKTASATPSYRKIRTASGSVIYQSAFSIEDVKNAPERQKENESLNITKIQKPRRSLSHSKFVFNERLTPNTTSTACFSSKSRCWSGSLSREIGSKTGFNSVTNSYIENNMDGLVNVTPCNEGAFKNGVYPLQSSNHFLFNANLPEKTSHSPSHRGTKRSGTRKKTSQITLKLKQLEFLKTTLPTAENALSKRSVPDNTPNKRKSFDLKEGRIDVITRRPPTPGLEFLQSVLGHNEMEERSKVGTARKPFCMPNPRLNQRTTQICYVGSYRGGNQKVPAQTFKLSIKSNNAQQPIQGTRVNTLQDRLNNYMSKFETKRGLSVGTLDSKPILTTESDRFSTVFSVTLTNYAKLRQRKTQGLDRGDDNDDEEDPIKEEATYEYKNSSCEQCSSLQLVSRLP